MKTKKNYGKVVGFALAVVFLVTVGFSLVTNALEDESSEIAVLKTGIEVNGDQSQSDLTLTKCGGDEEKKCGEGTDEGDEKKCGEGDEKCGEGKCGEGDEKCGEGKCGDGDGDSEK